MLEQCRWKSVGGKLRGKSGTVLVAQCGGSVEQCWWNSGTVLVEQWNSGTVMVKPCNSDSGIVWWKSGTVWWNSRTVMVEQCRWNSDVEH